MADDAIRAAIEQLHSKLEEQLRAAANTKRAINVLLATMGESPEFDEVEEPNRRRSLNIRPDQFFRKGITSAAHEYLKAKGGAASVEEIIDALKRGGCDMGASALRNVKISLSKNSKTFALVRDDPDNPGSAVFGLWTFYGGSPNPRGKKTDEEPVSGTENGGDVTDATTDDAQGPSRADTVNME